MTDRLSDGYDLKRLQRCVRPLVVRHAAVMTSTNDRARQEVESGLLDGPALVVADAQSAGRGRGHNSWWSAAGNLMATFVLSQNPTVPPGLVPLLAGLAVRRALVEATGLDGISLKWPNDVLIGERKTAGLLCQRLQRVDLIGIGVNVNAGSDEAPEPLRGRISSLREATGRAWDLTDVLSAVSRQLTSVLSTTSRANVSEMMAEYALHHALNGRDIALIDTDEAVPLTGRCRGIDAEGRLLVETRQGMRSILTGSVMTLSGTRE